MAKTDVEIERLGWTPEQGREHLRDFQEINYPNKQTTPDTENTEE
nr:hypothetical protein [Nostoc mirabile]